MPDFGAYSDWAKPLIAHPIWKEYQAIAVEHRMVSRDGFFAGSFDGLMRGFDQQGNPNTWLMDLKTLKHAGSPTRSIAKQAGAYICLLNDNHKILVDRVVGVFSKPGSVEMVVEDPQDCIDAWQDCLVEFRKTLPDW